MAFWSFEYASMVFVSAHRPVYKLQYFSISCVWWWTVSPTSRYYTSLNHLAKWWRTENKAFMAKPTTIGIGLITLFGIMENKKILTGDTPCLKGHSWQLMHVTGSKMFVREIPKSICVCKRIEAQISVKLLLFFPLSEWQTSVSILSIQL